MAYELCKAELLANLGELQLFLVDAGYKAVIELKDSVYYGVKVPMPAPTGADSGGHAIILVWEEEIGHDPKLSYTFSHKLALQLGTPSCKANMKLLDLVAPIDVAWLQNRRLQRHQEQLAGHHEGHDVETNLELQ